MAVGGRNAVAIIDILSGSDLRLSVDGIVTALVFVDAKTLLVGRRNGGVEIQNSSGQAAERHSSSREVLAQDRARSGELSP